MGTVLQTLLFQAFCGRAGRITGHGTPYHRTRFCVSASSQRLYITRYGSAHPKIAMSAGTDRRIFCGKEKGAYL
jgi:hypothetical protein